MQRQGREARESLLAVAKRRCAVVRSGASQNESTRGVSSPSQAVAPCRKRRPTCGGRVPQGPGHRRRGGHVISRPEATQSTRPCTSQRSKPVEAAGWPWRRAASRGRGPPPAVLLFLPSASSSSPFDKTAVKGVKGQGRSDRQPERRRVPNGNALWRAHPQRRSHQAALSCRPSSSSSAIVHAAPPQARGHLSDPEPKA